MSLRRRRYYSTHPPLTTRQKAAIVCFLIAGILVALFLIFMFHLQGVLSGLAVTRVSNSVNRLVTESVEEALQSGEFQYQQLVVFEKDSQGRVSALQSNMAEFNRLQALIVQDILQRLSQVATSDLRIPIGTLTGSALLAGRGPAVTIRMQTVGSATARFSNEFSDAGINQTTHRIILNVDVSVSVLLPGFRTSTKVSNSFAVAETIIVGSVPDSYTYFHSDEETAEDYIVNNA